MRESYKALSQPFLLTLIWTHLSTNESARKSNSSVFFIIGYGKSQTLVWIRVHSGFEFRVKYPYQKFWEHPQAENPTL